MTARISAVILESTKREMIKLERLKKFIQILITTKIFVLVKSFLMKTDVRTIVPNTISVITEKPRIPKVPQPNIDGHNVPSKNKKMKIRAKIITYKIEKIYPIESSVFTSSIDLFI